MYDVPCFASLREVFPLSDGGEVGLDWMRTEFAADSPIIIILPGLTGGSQEEYVKSLVLSAKARGIRTVVFNNRGLGGVELKVCQLMTNLNDKSLPMLFADSSYVLRC